MPQKQTEDVLAQPLELSARRRRALFRAEHRGTKELDILLGRYARTHISQMGEAELAHFEALMVEPEPALQRALLHGEPGPAGFDEVIGRIRAFHGLKDGPTLRTP